MRRTSRWFPACILALVSSPLWLPIGSTSAVDTPPLLQDKLLQNATVIFQRAVATPSAAIPATLMSRARGIAVVPSADRDGEMYYGMGVLSARGARPDAWTPPAVVAFQGALRINLEVSSIDLVVVALTPRGLDYLSQNRSAPVGPTVFPGPLGEDTPLMMDTDLLAYIQFGNYFAGATVDRFSVIGMRNGNALVYGKPYSTTEILRGNALKVPTLAELWRNALVSYFAEMS